MARSVTERMEFEAIRELGFAAITNVYSGVGLPLEHPARVVEFQNLTNEIIYFSIGGVEDNILIPPNGFFLLDGKTNNFYLAEGDRIYARRYGDAPTEGLVVVTVIYGTAE